MVKKRDKKKSVPYQILMPPDLREQAVQKAKANDFRLARYLRMHVERFMSQPVSVSRRELDKFYNTEKV